MVESLSQMLSSIEKWEQLLVVETDSEKRQLAQTQLYQLRQRIVENYAPNELVDRHWLAWALEMLLRHNQTTQSMQEFQKIVDNTEGEIQRQARLFLGTYYAQKSEPNKAMQVIRPLLNAAQRGTVLSAAAYDISHQLLLQTKPTVAQKLAHDEERIKHWAAALNNVSSLERSSILLRFAAALLEADAAQHTLHAQVRLEELIRNPTGSQAEKAIARRLLQQSRAKR